MIFLTLQIWSESRFDQRPRSDPTRRTLPDEDERPELLREEPESLLCDEDVEGSGVL